MLHTTTLRSIPLLSTRARSVLLAACLIVVGGAGAQSANAQGWFSWLGGGSQPGDPDWWSANKKKAEFVPGEGYRVPGVDGYFDEQGRSINAPVDEVASAFTKDDEPDGLLPGLDPKRNYARAKAAFGQGPDRGMAQRALEEGERLYNERKYRAAARKLKTAVSRWPDSAIAGRAQFLLADSYYFQDKYADARDAYEKFLSEQRGHRDLDTAIERLWTIGQYWEKYYDFKKEATLQPNLFDKTRPTFDTAGNAIKAYEIIRLNDPTGPRADDAIMATAGIYFRRKQYRDADYHYALLRREYPRSEHQFDAHVLGLQSILRKYQGPDYDGAPLEEAKTLVKQIRTQFAGRLSPDEKDRLREAQAQVQAAIETRKLRLAEYYDKTSHYGAAGQIYAQIVDEHRGSPIAEQAQQRLAQLGGLPSVPEERLGWFVDLFPENRERTRVAGITEIAPGATRLATNPGDETGGVN